MKLEDLDPFEFGDTIANEHLTREYFCMLASYSIGYMRALHDAKKTEDKGSEK